MHLTAETVRRTMRTHNKTISGLAQTLGISQVRVRWVRAHGVHGKGFVFDWIEAITGRPPAI